MNNVGSFETSVSTKQSTRHQFKKPVILIRLHISDSTFVFVTDTRDKLPAAYPFCNWHHSKGKCKGKSVPLQAWSGPESSRKVRFPDFMKTAQEDGKVVSPTHRPHLPPGNLPGTHFC